MAAGSLTAAALRHRPRQALLVIALAAIVSASAVLGPLYSRAAELSMVRTVLSNAPAKDRGLVVIAAGDHQASPQQLAATLQSAKSRLFGPAVGGADAEVNVSDRGEAGFGLATAQLTSRDDLCDHLRTARGSCDLGAAGSALVSQRNADAFGIGVGDPLLVTDPDNPKVSISLRVVGVYRPYDASGDYWFGRSSNAVIPPTRPGTTALPALDSVFTNWPTLAARPLSALQTHADLPLRVDRIDLSTTGTVRGDASTIDQLAQTRRAAMTTRVRQLLNDSERQRQQSRTVVPLLAVQLALLGLVVLGFVCAAATESRRPEIALSRLRGQGAAGAAGLVLRELGLLVVIGALLGAVPGWLLAQLAASQWLAPGVSLELRWPAALAIVAAALAGLVTAAVTAAPTLRQPLVSLLRRVPPRSSALQVGLVEGGLVAVAAAGVVTLLSGTHRSETGTSQSDQGPIALLAPGLLAIAGGLLLAQALVPVAGPHVRRSLRRGRVAGALSSAQLARRPALRRLVAIITVAAGLLVFGVDTWAVSDRNREARAGVLTGAPVVLDVDASDTRALRDGVLRLDPRQRYATPVITSRSASEGGPKTTAVEPAAFARIARWGSADARPTREHLDALTVPTVRSIDFTATRLSLTAVASYSGVSGDIDGGKVTPRPMHIAAELVDKRNGRTVVASSAQRMRQGRVTYSITVPCADGCVFRALTVIRQFGDFDGVDMDLSVRRVRAIGPAGEASYVDLGPASDAAWQGVDDEYGTSPNLDPAKPVTLKVVSFGSTIRVQRGDVPVLPPVLTAGPVLDSEPGAFDPDPPALAPDLQGIETRYDPVGRVAQVPRTGPRGVLVNLDLLDAVGGPPTAQTAYSVWLAADDPARERRLVAGLRGEGITVTGRHSIADQRAALAAEGPALALRLALLAGVVALILAATVLVVGIATSGPSRARDLAGLRLVGVPAAVVRSAAVREHVVVAVLGTVVGVALGLAAAQAALPRIPFFAHAGPRLPTVLAPAWPAVAIAGAGCLAVLVVVSVVVGRSLAAMATPDRTRQER